MKIQISDHFNLKKLMQFTIPSIIMMMFSSIYNVVDGYFVSNYAGKTQFAAVNLIMPFLIFFIICEHSTLAEQPQPEPPEFTSCSSKL